MLYVFYPFICVFYIPIHVPLPRNTWYLVDDNPCLDLLQSTVCPRIDVWNDKCNTCETICMRQFVVYELKLETMHQVYLVWIRTIRWLGVLSISVEKMISSRLIAGKGRTKKSRSAL